MMSVMNLSWFFACLCVYLGGEKFDDPNPYNIGYFVGYYWCACGYAVLFGLSHWMFVMNYFTLALRIKYTKRDFDSELTRLNVLYYSVAALNFIVPIIGTALYKLPKVS
jgi:hypothetical protein